MRRTTVYLLILAASWCLNACQDGNGRKETPPVPVTAAHAVKRTIPVQVQAIGTVEANQTVAVKSQMTGTIKKVHFTEGQDVRKGDLLVELDCRENEAALRQAEANLARDRAGAAYAREQARRYADLVQKDYVARDQYDQAVANATSLEAEVKADEALLESSRVQAAYCSIFAPVSGRIGKLLVNEGNIVSANATQIAVINQVSPVFVSFTVPEKTLSSIRRHAEEGRLVVEASAPGDAGGPEKGVLSFVDNAIDRATGTITLKATFANADRHLWPGQYVDVVLTLTTLPDAVLVPSRAVEQGPEGQYVYVVKQDLTVEMRPVVPGGTLKHETVIAKGLSEGEQVVTDGQLRLEPGAKVLVRDGK